jgi:hypothetical protein
VNGKACGVIEAKKGSAVLPPEAAQVHLVAEIDTNLKRAQALRQAI